jgi:hypothetical protein
MPITIQAAEGVLTAERKRQVVAGVSNAQVDITESLDIYTGKIGCRRVYSGWCEVKALMASYNASHIHHD